MTALTTRKKIGRPLKMPPTNAADLIRDLAADGFTKIGVARRMGVANDTFYRWLEDHPELQDAFDQGRERERWALHNLLYRQAMEDGNATAAMFLLKARHGYREGDQSDQAGRVNVSIALPGAMTLQQFTTMTQPGTAIEGKVQDNDDD